MTEPDVQHQECSAEDEIHLPDYWRVIRKRQKLIIRVVVAAVLVTVVISLLMTDIYQAKAVITPIASKEGGAGVGTLSALALQFGALPGIVLPGGSSAAEIVNLLKSNILREKVIERYQLLPVLFYKEWDTEKKDWKRGTSLNPLVYVGMRKDTGVPDVWDGLRTLDSIVKVNQNIKENIIIITVDYYDPVMAAKMVEYFLTALTDHMSSEARRVATINQKYLEEQLGKTADPLIKQKIYNLIAQQLETSMMAEVKENFAFKVIDPPMVPDMKIKPKRIQMALLSFVVSIFIGVFLAFLMEHFERSKSKEREYIKT
ncbi:MAG: Wzz/FepE/Etk N-terminal domain-containing protein [Syntrophales bacterium]